METAHAQLVEQRPLSSGSSKRLALATTSCRLIGLGAMVTGAVMVLFSRGVEATTDHLLVDSIVHTSNVKFMAAMWFVIGLVFVAGAPHIDETNTWRLLQIAFIGISSSALVRIIEMVRLDDFAGYGLAAAAVELIVPPITIWLRRSAVLTNEKTKAVQI